jgi:hypothetical protein
VVPGNVVSRVRAWMGDRRVAAVLAAVAVLAVGYRLYQPGARPTAPPQRDVEASAPSETVGGDGATVPVSVPTRAPAALAPGWSGPRWAWSRNPFLPAEAQGPSPASADGAGEKAVPEERLPELRGTVVGNGSGLAIFGDRLVAPGGAVGDWTLLKVEPYRVSLRRGRETRIVEIYRQ